MIQMELYSSDVLEKKKLRQEIIPKTNVEQIKGNGRSYPYLYPIRDLIQRKFHKGFHVCIDQGRFLKNFTTNSEL
jgi:regulator of replication initiation timing